MNDKKHIDRLFQEKLKDFEASPSHAVWENISAELNADKKDRKVIPLWLKLSAIAAVLLLLFTVGNNVFNTSDENPDQNTIVDTNTNSDTDLNDTNPENKENNVINNNNTLEQDELASENVDDNSENNQSTNRSESIKLVSPNNKASDAIVVNNSNNKSNPTQKLNRNIVEKTLNSTQKDALAQTNELDKKNKFDNNTSENAQINKEVIDTSLDKNNNSENAVANVTSKENNNISESETGKKGEVAKEEEKKSIEDALAENILEDNANDEKKKKNTIEDRWKVSPSIAPVYFNTLGAGSSLHEQFNENSKTGDVNMSYGVRGSYALNDKLSVRAGVNKVTLGYSTNDIFTLRNVSATPTDDRLQLRNVKMKEDIDVVSFISAEGFAYAQIPSVLSDQVIGSIDQKLGFIEIPLELEYELSDQKLGLRVLGGFSALFLNENEVFSTLNGETTLIGEATNINKTSFSANLGVGLDFKLSEKFKLNLEPTFKYQLNTFNNTSGDFKPYFIGIYSGFSFKF